MKSTADVVVIGGGTNGTSTAFHLTLLGVRNVVLLERRQLAAGATGKSGALVRMHYTNETESRMALESLKVFRNFGEVVGGDCGFEGVGFVQLVGPQYAAALARNVARQQRLGIATKLITPAEVREILPGCEIADVGAAAWEADSGFADPAATAFAFAEAARNRGATHRDRRRGLAGADRGRPGHGRGDERGPDRHAEGRDRRRRVGWRRC